MNDSRDADRLPEWARILKVAYEKAQGESEKEFLVTPVPRPAGTTSTTHPADRGGDVSLKVSGGPASRGRR